MQILRASEDYLEAMLEAAQYSEEELIERLELGNYRMLFSQSTFWKAIGNTILMAVMGLLTIPVGFLLAVLVNSLGRSRLQEFFRVGFYLPNIITGVSVYLIFRVVLMTDGGLLNNVLSAITGRQVSIGWLADPKFARWGVTIIWVWMNAGYSMLMNLASLQAIPTDLYEAASIDGANAIQKLVAITVPNMKSCFALLFVTGMINGLARFTDIYILGGMDCYGGAGGTLQTILMYVFQFSFETPNYGVASAGSMVLFALVFVMTMINVKLTGFLQNMVRILVGTLLEVGRGYWEPAYVQDILAARDRKLAGPTAPPEGLCLMKVDY